jgi:hypothetical protein
MAVAEEPKGRIRASAMTKGPAIVRLPERLCLRFPRVGTFVAAFSVVVASVAATTALATPAFASPSGDLAAATNNSRAAAGLPALQLNAQLNSVAQAWANHLAATNDLEHNGALRSQVSNWTNLGENVGMAGDISSVQRAFMNSPDHRANILNSKYTEMGVGSATSTYPSCGCTVLWVVVDFKRPATVAAPINPTPVKPAPPKAAPVQKAPPVVTPAKPATPVKQAATPANQAAQLNKAAQPATRTNPATPATTAAAPASPSASSSASALGSKLAAAAANPDGATTDPVSRVLTFASVMSQLPS